MNLVSDRASSAVDWRLFLPESWDDSKHGDDALLAEAILRRRAKAGIPEIERHREKWRLALDMLDEMHGRWELPDLPVVADAGYGDATGFREGLTERGLAYSVAVKATTTAHPGDAAPERPPYSGQGRPPVSAYPQRHTTLRQLALDVGRSALRTVAWRPCASAAGPGAWGTSPAAHAAATREASSRRGVRGELNSCRDGRI